MENRYHTNRAVPWQEILLSDQKKIPGAVDQTVPGIFYRKER